MAKWLGRQTLNPEVACSSPALTTYLELFLGRPQFNSSATFVNSQLVCLLPVGILHYLFHHLFPLVLKSPVEGVVK